MESSERLSERVRMRCIYVHLLSSHGNILCYFITSLPTLVCCLTVSRSSVSFFIVSVVFSSDLLIHIKQPLPPALPLSLSLRSSRSDFPSLLSSHTILSILPPFHFLPFPFLSIPISPRLSFPLNFPDLLPFLSPFIPSHVLHLPPYSQPPFISHPLLTQEPFKPGAYILPSASI